jgi:hypothetical protein
VKKFQFPLQKVLEYDTHIQKNESDILAALMAEYERLEKKRDEMQAVYNEAKRIYREIVEQYPSSAAAVQAKPHAQ